MLITKLLDTPENSDKTFQQDKNATKLTETPENRDKTFHGKQNLFKQNQTGEGATSHYMSWMGEEWGPTEPPPLPREGSHRTEPDSSSLENLRRCLLLFQAWRFTPIVHKLKTASEPWNISRPVPPEVDPQSWSFRVKVQFYNLGA